MWTSRYAHRLSQGSRRFLSSASGENIKVTLFPGDGIGPEISSSVQKIFSVAQVPITWEAVDVTPVKSASGKFIIPPESLEPMRRTKIGLKGPLATPIGKGLQYNSCKSIHISRSISMYSYK